MSLFDQYYRRKAPIMISSAQRLKSFDRSQPNPSPLKILGNEQQTIQQQLTSNPIDTQYTLKLPGGGEIEHNKKYKIGEKYREQIMKSKPVSIPKRTEIKSASKHEVKKKTVSKDVMLKNLSRSMTNMMKR